MSETVTVTCHTAGCGNEGAGVEMPAGAELDGEWQPIGSYVCGVCGQTIEDVEGVPEPEPEPPVVDNELPPP